MASARIPAPARRPAALPVHLACALLAAGACQEPTGTGLGSDGPVEALGYERAWIGRFTGPGQGIAGGSIVAVSEAVLTITRDADSVRVAACPRCLTVALDTLFVVSNVPPSDPQRIEIVYEVGGARRSLTLEKFSGAGSVSNVVLATLTLRALDGGLLAEIAYVLEAG